MNTENQKVKRSKEFCRQLAAELGRSRATYYRWARDGIPARLLKPRDPEKEAAAAKQTVRRRNAELERLRAELQQATATIASLQHQIELLTGSLEEWREAAGMSRGAMRHSGFVAAGMPLPPLSLVSSPPPPAPLPGEWAVGM
jgi:transposase-like protein